MEKNTMSWNFKNFWPAATLSLIGVASAAQAANNRSSGMKGCEPIPGHGDKISDLDIMMR